MLLHQFVITLLFINKSFMFVDIISRPVVI
jgi:hypothetical protein